MSTRDVRLSARTAWTLEVPALERRAAALRSTGRPIVDLTVTNPTAVGLHHPRELYERLGDPSAARYDPAPLGMVSARRAVAEYYAAREIALPPERVWLTASTSEAYAHLFALLCDRGDAVLVPTPGYPLLGVLADIADIRLLPYPLFYDGTWNIDLGGLRQQLEASPKARAIVVVAPNNPTGNYLKGHELAVLGELATQRGVPLIVDEVFADYPLRPDPGRLAHIVGPADAITFVLSGLSKVAALPQMKLSWIAVHGDERITGAVLERAELLADAFLSVSTPTQLALHEILEGARTMQRTIASRTTTNLGELQSLTRDTPLDVLHVEGGWTALVRLPEVDDLDDQGWALDLLEHAGVLVQPGSAFGLSAPPRVAVSLLTQSHTFGQGVGALVDRVQHRCRGASD